MILDLDLNIFRFVQLFYLFTCLFYSWIIRSKLRTEIVVLVVTCNKKSIISKLSYKQKKEIKLML